VNIDNEIAKRNDAIDKLKARADELRAQCDAVMANIPCDRQDAASQKMQGITNLISKAEGAVSKLKEEIRILTCIKNNKTYGERESCASRDKEVIDSMRGRGGENGKSGNSGDHGANARDRTKGRLGDLQRCIGESGGRGSAGAGK
jgi:phage shock protein A